MTDQLPSPERLVEVSRLADALAECIRVAQMLDEVVEDVQIMALVEAALLLEENGVPQPPLVIQALQKVDDDIAARSGQPTASDADPTL